MTIDVLCKTEIAAGDSESEDDSSVDEVQVVDEESAGESIATQGSADETSASEDTDNDGNVDGEVDRENTFGDSTAATAEYADGGDSVVVLAEEGEDSTLIQETGPPNQKLQHQGCQGSENKGRRNNFQGKNYWKGGPAKKGKGKWENKNYVANKGNFNRNNSNCETDKIGLKSQEAHKANHEKKVNKKEISVFNDGPLKFNYGTPSQKQSHFSYQNSVSFKRHTENQNQNSGSNKNQEKGGKKQNNNSTNNNNNNNKGKGNNDEHPKDFFKFAKAVIEPFWKKKEKAEPVDSFVLKLHYRMSVCLFIVMFTIVQSNWYVKESIKCVSAHFTCTGELPFHLKNFCLSFSYVCDLTSALGDSCSRRYLLFYRWIHTSFLVIGCLYYIPRFIAKKVMNPRLKKLLYDLACDEARYDDASCEQVTEKMLKFVDMDRGSRSQYLWLVFCHVIALLIDFGVMFFFDFMLQNRFIGLLYHSYPYRRNPPHFTDYISQTFPPFANCTVHVENLINVEREETFGCYLYLMELYDKIFILLWLWLVFLSFVTIFSILVMLLVSFSPFNHLFLCLFTPSARIGQMRRKVQSMSNLNDLYTLYLMKQHCSESQFIRFIAKLIHNSEDTLEEVLVMKREQEKKCDSSKEKCVIFDGHWNREKEDVDPKSRRCPLNTSTPQYSETRVANCRTFGRPLEL